MTPPLVEAAAVAFGVVMAGDAMARRWRRRAARRSVDAYLQWIFADLAVPARPSRRAPLTLAHVTESPHASPRRAHLALLSPPSPVGALTRVEQP